ncbi:hypothetical protein P7H76_02510 [Lactococcus lactis]|uniref:hypothetical protein n=1 Tax=Lactococcus lactis TaxID=1358 RepID=UPI00288D562B|nr:hypothetical protein [Lactococcus lactis]MDT2886053.1 hypothetical protein [Lactococcus lactis]
MDKIIRYLKKYYSDEGRAKRWFLFRNIFIKSPKSIVGLCAFLYVKRLEEKSCSFIGTTLHSCAHFESQPYFAHHGHNIHINESARFGINAYIHHNVTVGRTKDGVGPIIGNNVSIGTGAIILDDAVIGNNVKIGANAIVTKVIPDNCTVIGVNNIINHKNYKQ